MKKQALIYLLCPFFILSLFLGVLHSHSEEVLFREDFNNLNNFKTLHFPTINNYTSYTIESNRTETYLKAVSKSSASALVYKREFNVYKFPEIRWRWKVENVYIHGNAHTKRGDDYPLRIYVIFKYDPKKAGPLERLSYEAKRLLYKRYPPHSSLNYIWANHNYEETVLVNPYTERSRMILLEKGEKNVGRWQTEEENIIKDYKKAFGCMPPPMASLAIMNDSDDTGESSVSYIDYIMVYKKE